MPNTKSAKKRLRQNKSRRDHNRSKRSTLRSHLRRVREAVADGDIAKAETEYVQAARQLDRAGSSNLIHKNTAARTKSRLQRLIKSAKASA